ncbi:MAG: hypothetical protein IJR97_00840 [Clostridia bacterium]|nr:hypothetical protein [Clostridia bacterium]
MQELQYLFRSRHPDIHRKKMDVWTIEGCRAQRVFFLWDRTAIFLKDGALYSHAFSKKQIQT